VEAVNDRPSLEDVQRYLEELAAEGLIEQCGTRNGRPLWIATKLGKVAFGQKAEQEPPV
jgi:hypothetical protein